MRAFFGATDGGLTVALSQDGRLYARADGGPTADLLVLLETVLKKAKAKKTAIDEIVVDRGPGGFSSVRRRVAVATGLARALGAAMAAVGEISVEDASLLPTTAFDQKAAIAPLYAAEPNITISKKKKTWNAR